ncbi:MAG: GIY-YIG nuclease family protein [Alphaproteobacteria bacterium]|nr:GIY-YIG nuclease family protein [Alphaproteobacteria bacterium]
MEGIVYILTNEAMPSFVKVGKTNDLMGRIRSLSSSTSIPLEFECYYAARVADVDKVEKLLHDAFDDYRRNPRREFFTANPARVKAALMLAELEDITPTREEVIPDKAERAAIDDLSRRRRDTTLYDLHVNKGEKLTFDRDPSLTCVVHDESHVHYSNNIYSLSAAAMKVFEDIGIDRKAANGWYHWKYEGQRLTDMVDKYLAGG